MVAGIERGGCAALSPGRGACGQVSLVRTEWWAVWELITWGKDWAKGPAVAELPGEGGMDPEKRSETLLLLGRK